MIAGYIGIISAATRVCAVVLRSILDPERQSSVIGPRRLERILAVEMGLEMIAVEQRECRCKIPLAD